MKNLKYFILTIVLAVCLLPYTVFAAGNVSVSTTKLTVKKGSTATFKITANNAAGRVDITSSNPSVATVSDSSLFLDMQSGTITVTGKSAGTTTITIVTTDVTTYDDEDISGKKYTVTVTVTDPTPNTNTNKPTNNNKPSYSNTNNNNLSKNNNLKELSVEGQTLHKEDNNHYTLTVGNNVTNITINAIAEDTKAKVNGTGKKDIKVGENNFDIIVTSESGAQNKINLKVTRKENYDLGDLDSLLNSNKEEFDIVISDDTVIPAATIQKIKDKKKKVNFNYYDENKKLKYTWIVEGNKVSNPKDVLTTITYSSDKKKEISKASNYADGLYVDIKHKGELPKGIKVKLSVEDKFEDGYVLRLYQYEEGKLTSVREDLNVKNGFIEFEVEKGNNYFVTMSSIGSPKEKEESEEVKESNLFLIISIVELFVIIVLIVMMGKKNNKKEIRQEEKVEELPISKVKEEKIIEKIQ